MSARTAVHAASLAASPDPCISVLALSTPREAPTAMSAGERSALTAHCTLFTALSFIFLLTWPRSAAVARRSTALYQRLAVHVVDIHVASDYSSVTASSGVYVVLFHTSLQLPLAVLVDRAPQPHHRIPSVRATPILSSLRQTEGGASLCRVLFAVCHPHVIWMRAIRRGCRCDESAGEIAETTHMATTFALTLHGCDRLVSLDGDL
jgi:hypothetical protein